MIPPRPVLRVDDPFWLDEATAVIKGGGVVAIAYERLFGLAVDALNPKAVDRVVEIKGRDVELQPISVILPNKDALDRVVLDFSPLAVQLSNRHWPGMVTLLVKAGRVPNALVGPNGLIGVRLPGACHAALLAEHCGLILTATSANKAGEKDAESHEDVLSLAGVDLIIEGRVFGPPGSTIVDASGDHPKVLRQGAVVLGDDL